MDISFDIDNSKGDRIKVALSYLFSRMFDMYTYANCIDDFINYRIKFEDGTNLRIAHFITPKRYLSVVESLGEIILSK